MAEQATQPVTAEFIDRTETLRYTVAGAPPLDGAGPLRTKTIEPEILRLEYLNGALNCIAIKGRLVRRDGRPGKQHETAHWWPHIYPGTAGVPDWAQGLLAERD